MLAQLIDAEPDWAEFFFILAAVAFIIDAVIRLARPPQAAQAAILTVAGLACLAIGFICW